MSVRTAEEIETKVATAIWNLELMHGVDGSGEHPLDGAHYTLNALLEWIRGD